MKYDIEIATINSSSIRQVAQIRGQTHMRELGSANTDSEQRPDWGITLYEMADGYRVISTNADCITQDEEGFGELEAACLS